MQYLLHVLEDNLSPASCEQTQLNGVTDSQGTPKCNIFAIWLLTMLLCIFSGNEAISCNFLLD